MGARTDLLYLLRARSIGLIRIRRTPPFSDDAFDSAQLNPDESSIRAHPSHPKKLWMSSDELDTRPHPREDVKVLRLPQSFGSQSNGRATQLISSRDMSVVDGSESS